MIKNYRLFYTYKKENDILTIIFNNDISTLSLEYENLLIYKNKDVINKIELLNFHKHVKIKNDGEIFLPHDAFIDVINVILQEHNLELLDYKTNSSYFVKQLHKDENGQYFVTFENQNFYVEDTIGNLKYPSILVVQFLNGNARLVLENELETTQNVNYIYVNNKQLVDKDFFEVEVN